MNKRQKKKKLKKTLPLFTDESPLLNMTESEIMYNTIDRNRAPIPIITDQTVEVIDPKGEFVLKK
ncbi:hypothetical protein [Enterococcus raffinosus]|uniref:hypothetical protein n=1 Tax=Enterococcus raffinosus TaxID=71452 RepID=UPI003ABFBC35